MQVKVGARGRTLHVDGTTASYFAPGRALTGPVWDALAAPLAWLPPPRRRRVLILGLGGGSAARVARALAPRARLVGVELDAGVVRAARRWFDLDALRVEVVAADAHAWLRRARGRFDVVIDDVFVGRGRDAHKPDWLPEPGLARARRLLAPGGLLVANALDEAPATLRALARLCPGVVAIQVDGYDNRIGVAGPAALHARALRAAVTADPLLAPVAPKLSFRTVSGKPRGAR